MIKPELPNLKQIVRANSNSEDSFEEQRELVPSIQASAELQYAVNHLNGAFWNGKVPNPILTYTNKANCLGYFVPDKFQRSDGLVVSVIALNSAYLAVRPLELSLSTLAHELVHAWRHYLGPLNRKGSKGKSGYHDSVWANEMERIGLMPTSTGLSGGKRTGYRVTHFIIKDGLFDLSCQELLDSGFRISWADRIVRTNSSEGGDGTNGVDPGNARANARKRDRIKFTCSNVKCGLNAWAKPTALLICGHCRGPMHPAETLVAGK
ncbi:MAG: hypothetical protein AAFQ58_23500 [Pseudomonadota bacterium]